MVESIKPVPRLIPRQSGGWLAVSPSGASLKIGVAAETEDGALLAFEHAFIRWQDHLKSGEGGYNRL